MKKIVFLIGLFVVLFACSDDKNEVMHEETLEERIKKAVQDSIGLKLLGKAAVVYTDGDTCSCFWGCKLGKFWYCLHKNYDYWRDELKIIEEHTSCDILRDTFPIVLGYGKELTFVLSEQCVLSKDDNLVQIWQHKPGTFLCDISTWLDGVYATILIQSKDGNLTYNVGWTDMNGGGIGEWVRRLWFDDSYVINRKYGNNPQDRNYYIVDAAGNDICMIKNDILKYNLSVMPVSLYDFIYDEINRESISLSRCSVNKSSSDYAWKIDLPIGKVISEYAPKITCKTELKGSVMIVDARAVNYDGSEEVKKYEVDIETGEYRLL